jgi:hypothetical protein
LTEQAIYDWKNSMRKASEINDFDDDDYSEDEDIFIVNETTTTLEMKYDNLQSSSSSRFRTKFIYLLLFLTQTNK